MRYLSVPKLVEIEQRERKYIAESASRYPALFRRRCFPPDQRIRQWMDEEFVMP